MKRDPFCRFYIGRDWMRGPGFWVAWLALVPRRSLMTRPDDEGRMILAGLHLEANFATRNYIWRDNSFCPRVWFRAWSDADEISSRIAENCGA